MGILPTGHERAANDLYWKRLPGLGVLSLHAQSRTDSYPLPRRAWPTRCLDPLIGDCREASATHLGIGPLRPTQRNGRAPLPRSLFVGAS